MRKNKAASGGKAPSPPLKTKELKVRFTPDEYDDLAQKAALAGLSMAELVRRAVKRTRTWTVKEKAEVQALRRELAAWGNNLNQIARQLNTVAGLDPADVLKCYRELYKIRAGLERLTEKYLS